jgi:hypothetical protein
VDPRPTPTRLYALIATELDALIGVGECGTAQLTRCAPTIVAMLAGQGVGAARAARVLLIDAADSLPEESRYAARALLAIDGCPRTTRKYRRTLAGRVYGHVGADRFKRGGYESDVVTALTLALAERADPLALAERPDPAALAERPDADATVPSSGGARGRPRPAHIYVNRALRRAERPTGLRMPTPPRQPTPGAAA